MPHAPDPDRRPGSTRGTIELQAAFAVMVASAPRGFTLIGPEWIDAMRRWRLEAFAPGASEPTFTVVAETDLQCVEGMTWALRTIGAQDG